MEKGLLLLLHTFRHGLVIREQNLLLLMFLVWCCLAKSNRTSLWCGGDVVLEESFHLSDAVFWLLGSRQHLLNLGRGSALRVLQLGEGHILGVGLFLSHNSQDVYRRPAATGRLNVLARAAHQSCYI
ncbi:hypothetical protein CRENBAI_001556 [Crenichthys baileyi]|uniref:Secreted protein n=1 Tax=Crenichthys baileyi TaxID=28760 RepID=A0AAV9RP18_9TELE